MGAVTEPPARSGREWLEALASGACDENEFLHTIGGLLETTPDAAWEALAQLEQYFRRGKMDPALFRSLKSRLEGLGINGADEPVHHTVATPVPEVVHHTVATPPPELIHHTVATPTPELVHHTVATPPPELVHHTVATPGPPVFRAPLDAPGAQSIQSATVDAMAARARPATRPATRPVAQGADLAASTAAAASNDSRSLVVGYVLRERYRIEAVIGNGGMGTVFEAVDLYRLDLPHLSQRLAIKVLHSKVTGRPEVLSELRHEFQHLQTLSHPNIVRVHEFDRDGELAFFTMELLRGALLSRLAASGRTILDRTYALAIIRDVGAALTYAHARGVVHGDVKPQNIFITSEGEVRVLDFGAAQAVRRGPWISDFESAPNFASATPAFASCEVLESLSPDARDDLYSFACVVYILLAGRHPFDELSAVEARSRRMTLVRPPGLSKRQWLALREGLAWSRSARPADLAAWLALLDLEAASPRLPPLDALMANLPPPPRPLNAGAWAAGAAAGVVVLIGGAWYADRPPRSPGGPAGMALTAAVKSGLTEAHSVSSQLLVGARRLMGLDSGAAADGGGAVAGVLMSPLATTRTQVPGDAAAASPTPAAGSAPDPAGAAAFKSGTVSRPTMVAAISAAGMAGTTVTSPAAATPAHSTATPAPTPAAPAPTPAARVELADDLVEVSPADPVARVTVRRHGSVNGATSFEWWTEAGTAKPGDDFVPVSGRTERIPDGKDSIKLWVPVVSDPTRREAKDFYVAIGSPGAGAKLGARTRAMVIIPAAN